MMERAMHASAPEGLKCADCTLAEQPCPTCYTDWWKKQHPNVQEISVVSELPVGKYNAVRTLRHSLQRAENGEFDQVLIICQRTPGEDDDGVSIDVVWSDMRRLDVLWFSRWLNSFVNYRYFDRYRHDEEEEE